CQSDAAESLPEDQKPECHPFWTDDDECNMPLPYDLEEVIAYLQNLAQ
ncbi:Alpha-ketoglutarate-dependent dioxygenase FTO, partial [Acanthisitta chloris]